MSIYERRGWCPYTYRALCLYLPILFQPTKAKNARADAEHLDAERKHDDAKRRRRTLPTKPSAATSTSFLAASQRSALCHAPCDGLYIVPVLIGC